MLKRLELVGFKSFADKTVFDFAPGITAIVGPNGSGKTNVVDAVKWVLGEQSAKSLRGGEMSDVIFNGSSSRRSLGLAEVTMTFDNARKFLNVDGAEVQITRRVYRDGQGEYLINQQPSRLRDIKDLFLGSGAGHGAYSIIEQGRVDALLQASHKDRRQIFEEAAGISRFKARKIETLRKLETVEQNLQRSNDLLAELDKQLRSVKLQATKAQRYQEYSTRLQELRVGLGLQEYHELTTQLQIETDGQESLKAELDRAAAETSAGEASLRQLDAALGTLEEALHQEESRLADARQQIAALEAKRTFESSSAKELEHDLTQARMRRGELSDRIAETTELVDKARHEFQSGAGATDEGRARVRDCEQLLHDVETLLDQLRRQVDTDRADHLECLRQTTRLQNDAISLKTRLDNMRSRRDGLNARSSQTSERLTEIQRELADLQGEEQRLGRELTGARDEHGRNIDRRDELRREAAAAGERLNDRRVQRSGIASRVELLEQLEKSQEGLGLGVREVLDLVRHARETSAGTPDDDWQLVVGLVADCLTVPREFAALVDLALGDLAQFFVVRDPDKLDAMLRQRTQPFAGRVGFIPLRRTERGAQDEVDFTALRASHFALEECADTLVACDHPDLRELPGQLLGTTRIVPDLAAARAAAARPENLGLRFLTRTGELLEPDGRVIIGTHHAETGIVSRKSELRDLRQQAVEQDHQIAEAERELAQLREQAEALDQPIYDLQQKINDLVEDVGDVGARVKLHQQKHSGLKDEVETSRCEIDGLEDEIGLLTAALAEATRTAEAGEREALAIQQRIEQANGTQREREQERLQREQECSQARVELAQLEERLAGQRDRLKQMEAALAERADELAKLERAETTAYTRIRDSQLAILHASTSLATCYVQKEAAEQALLAQADERERLRAERQALAEHLQGAIAVRQEKSDAAHAHELRASQLRSRRDTIVDRLREDYQLDLAERYALSRTGDAQPADPAAREPQAPLDPVETQQEIEDLRKKLTRLGAVNLDALQEMNDLEQRLTEKQGQHADLAKSQHDLLEIIAKINQDSKKLFTDAFASIRTQFQELFRRLFGGGMADIVLEDENDVLESGIEITARPPGKELRSISLMSGGERTLTAIALLLAIFRSKPSPFCLLDEVDASLDESNNARLAGVLREFLEMSQFIVVTHKKRTMAVADILYGISMQEAGVSKQIAVRFEDWPEDVQEDARVAG